MCGSGGKPGIEQRLLSKSQFMRHALPGELLLNHIKSGLELGFFLGAVGP